MRKINRQSQVQHVSVWRARAVGLALVALLICSAPAGSTALVAAVAQQVKRARPAQTPRLSKQQTKTAQLIPDEIMLRIVRAEDERRWDETDLGALLTDRSAAVRRRAALAAGRIGDEDAVGPLTLLLRRDSNIYVRAMAAFALGETESPAGVDALLETLRSRIIWTEVRARSMEALGKIAAALPKREEARQRALGEAIIEALNSEHQQLAGPDRAVVLAGLTAALRARPPEAGKTVALFLSSPDARLRADAANSLARLRAKDGADRLRGLLTGDVNPIVRANAARALGVAEDQASSDALVSRIANDADARVRTSAIRAVASLKDARAAAPLLQRGDALLVAYRAAKEKDAAAHPQETSELLEIAAALGRLLVNTNDERAVTWLRAFREAEGWSAPEVEVALARVGPAQYLRERPFNNFSDPSARAAAKLRWQSISALAQGLGGIAAITSAMGGNSAVSVQADAQLLLRAMLDDAQTPALALPDVLRALATFKPPDLETVLRAKLGGSTDVIVRATAAELMGELPPDPATSGALAEALPVAMKDAMNDAALSILDALAKQKTPEASAAIKTALEVPDYLLRRRAAALLKEDSAAASEEQKRVDTVATRNRPADYQRALARIGTRVRAQVTTDKGSFTIELLPDEAPLTVDNFVELARRKYFDGQTFHRVVPNFVIQGGDPRGDGNGGPGHQIRCEINEASYERGAVGMALSGKDTGGSQWFVTHSPQPHLDGGYTVFGRVVEGMEIVDAVVRGDPIRSISITEGKRPPVKPKRPATR